MATSRIDRRIWGAMAATMAAACGTAAPEPAGVQPGPAPAVTPAETAPAVPAEQGEVATMTAGFPVCADVDVPRCGSGDEAAPVAEVLERQAGEQVRIRGVIARGEGQCARTEPPDCETFLRIVAPGEVVAGPVTDPSISLALVGELAGRSLICGVPDACCPLEPGETYQPSGQLRATPAEGDPQLHQVEVASACRED